MMAVSNLTAQLIQPTSITSTATFTTGGKADAFLDVQDSTITASGQAWGGRAYQGAYYEGSSSFNVLFDLTTPLSFVLNGVLNSEGGAGMYCSATVQLIGPTGTMFFVTAPGFREKSFLFDGVLDLGSYALRGVANGTSVESGWNVAKYSTSFVVTPIPEPTTWGLVILGLGALIVTKITMKRKRQIRVKSGNVSSPVLCSEDLY